MENMKGSTNFRNMVQTGKSSLLPPKIPFPSTSTLYPDFSINPSAGSKVNPKHKDISSYHQRTSSESLIGEEQPSWLDDLLDEPDTPVRKGHRRSSSDSFAYMDMGGVSNMDYASLLHDEPQSNNMSLPQSWRSQNVDCLKVNQRGFPFNGPSSYTKPMNRTWEWPLTSAKHPINPPSLRDNIIPYSEGSSSATEEAHSVRSTGAEKQDLGESGLSDSKFFSDNDGSYANVASDNESKRAKQKFAQRSRVRKLQYIAELERTVQALQAEGSEVSAELEFINQQSLILSMENKALKQRLESMAQEQLIKYLEHEMLEREIGRLRALYQQQQQQQPRQSTSTHRRTESKDLDSQFANLGLKHKDPSSGADTVHICDM